jgi:hypothetical protein
MARHPAFLAFSPGLVLGWVSAGHPARRRRQDPPQPWRAAAAIEETHAGTL